MNANIVCVVIEQGVLTRLSKGAFENCSGLTSVTIGNSVTSIGYSAFGSCGGLRQVFYKGSEQQWNKISIGMNNDYLTKATRYYQSKTEPAMNAGKTDYDGNSWHYDTDGRTPVI